MLPLAASFTVSGTHGWLVLIAFLLFVVSAALAWLAGRQVWATCIAAGLALYMLSLLITG